ncbi:hypothetical protein BDA99DRAFT_534433 [Phascolomyces articulosus]|uniref:Uncharacterized protein n=1 Tax=Phascolomyces articulosus TaxID=60185 RepID=A0AAD5PHA9_9FUNG|nr:hypothetical protein BDA99DRAFT_534433 [Phascolomyces articulosus]
MPTASVSSPLTLLPVLSSSGQAAPSFPHILSRQESFMSNGTTTSLNECFEALTSQADENEEAIDEIKDLITSSNKKFGNAIMRITEAISNINEYMALELEQDAEVANAKKQQMAEEDRGKMAISTITRILQIYKEKEFTYDFEKRINEEPNKSIHATLKTIIRNFKDEYPNIINWDKIVTDMTSKHHHNLKKDLDWTEEQKEEHNTNSRALTRKRLKLLNQGKTFADGRDVGKYTEYQDGALVMTMDHMSDEDTTDDEAKMMTREKKGLNVKKPLNDFYNMLDKDHGGPQYRPHFFGYIVEKPVPSKTLYWAIVSQPSVASSSASTSSAPSSPVLSPSDPSSSSLLLAALRHGF